MLALIAGQGQLPLHLMTVLDETPVIAALEGFAPDGITVDETFRIEQLGSFIASLTEKGISQVCFAGAIQRPPLDPSRIDPATMPLVPRMMAALQAGDDAALREVIAFFEEAGLSVVAADEIAPDLLPSAGVLTALQPTDQHKKDCQRAQQIAAATGSVDLGQCCAVHKGQAIGIETAYGTDWMLSSLAFRTDKETGGGVFYKAPKPGQDRRVDLPAIGPETLKRAAEGGLAGVVIETGGVMVLDLERTVQTANDLGLFLWVRTP